MCLLASKVKAKVCFGLNKKGGSAYSCRVQNAQRSRLRSGLKEKRLGLSLPVSKVETEAPFH